MGMIARLLGVGEVARGVGDAVENVAEVFTVNKTKAELALRKQAMASLDQYGTEFVLAREGWFDSLINGVNRLPRPILALGTVGLFVFAMMDPITFADRMQGLAYVPDPLWWLLGAVVSFYFGARELHYARQGNGSILVSPKEPARTATHVTRTALPAPETVEDNIAVADWLQNQQ